MSVTQIHLALNHIPVLLSITAAIILFFGLIKKNASIINTALALFIAAAIFTLPVYFTGEGTEESVEKIPGVSESIIEEHEEAAVFALSLIFLTGALATVSFILKNKVALSRKMATATLVAAFISFGAFAQTAHLGGQIRHTELRSNTSQNGNDNAAITKELEDD